MKIRIALPLIALALAAGAQAQSQATGKTIPVTATITGACAIQSGSQAVAFGAIDPSSTGRKTSPATSVSFNCTRDLAFQASIAGSSAPGSSTGTLNGLKMTSGSNELPYELSWLLSHTTGRGFGPGTEVALTLTAALDEADYRAAPAGDYRGDVVVDIQP